MIVTAAELVGATSMLNEPPAQQPSGGSTVPVLSVVGEDDTLFCTGVTAPVTDAVVIGWALSVVAP